MAIIQYCKKVLRQKSLWTRYNSSKFSNKITILPTTIRWAKFIAQFVLRFSYKQFFLDYMDFVFIAATNLSLVFTSFFPLDLFSWIIFDKPDSSILLMYSFNLRLYSSILSPILYLTMVSYHVHSGRLLFFFIRPVWYGLSSYKIMYYCCLYFCCCLYV